MLPFSKRPPPPEEYFLRSGDFEAVQPQQPPQSYTPSYTPRSNGPASMPVSVMPAPPPSVFARHAAPTPYGFTQSPQPSYGYGDLSAPPPPHSLAPVAMVSDRTGPAPVSTARRASSLGLGEKPSLKWGVMIALTGALLGGVLGLGMDAKRQREHAAAASELPDPAAAPPVAAAPAPQPASLLAGNGAIVAPPAPLPIAARAPVVLAPPAPLFVTPPKADPPTKPERHAKAPPAPAKHPSFVAGKVSAPKPPPAEKAERPEPAPKPEPVAKPERAPKPGKEPAKAGSSDARKVLEDAIKDTTNTL